ncbi:hypothetical protein [Solibacillus sp. FSL H8-0538]|uniref:hypothetical protein n=1 Tax=Solibacillus sp. FSL H8-0538 TaxID=2921400 RepID=UPI0030F646EF
MVAEILLDRVYPVIPDIYRSKNINLATEPRELKYYLVNQDLVNPLHIEGTEEIRQFFESSFFADNGSILLQPTGWKLEDELQNSITIRTFITFAKQIILFVDDKDKNVVLLGIYG